MLTRFRYGFAAVLVAGAAALATNACDSESPSGPASDPPVQPPADPPTAGALECEVQGYPCSLSEVPLEILERSDALGDEVAAMLQAGASVADAAAWLGEQEGMAEVEWDGPALRFRLEGGRGTWVWEEQVLVAENALPAAPPPVASAVVFEGLEHKRALVFSPFQWMFGSNDPGPAVAAILRDTRGYDHAIGVQFYGNSTPEPNPGGYFGWGSFQVIKVTTVGGRICSDDGWCRGALSAGVLEPEPGSTAEQLKSETEPGLEAAKAYYGGTLLTPDDHVVVTADFFRQRYPDGVNDAVIYLTAPAIMDPHRQLIDVAQALHGTNTVVIGWDGSIWPQEAAAAAVEMFRNLADRGYPAQVALEEIGALRTGSPSPLYPGGATLGMLERHGGGDVRIRDVVYLLHPVTGQVLTEPDRVRIDGIMGDGEPDVVPFLVQVDGVKEEFASGMFVHVSVDGVEGDPVPLTAGVKDEEDRWRVEGVVQLPYDLEEEREVSFRAWTNLHEGGESDHETLATLIGGEPLMGWEWEFEATHAWYVVGVHSTPRTSTAKLTLTFADDQAFDEPHPKYLITGGEVTINYNYEYSRCKYTGGTTYTVTDEYDPRFVYLTFDTSGDPVLYGARLFTRSPPFEYSVDCGSGPETRTRILPIWWLLREPGSYLPVPEDRQKIEGTYRETHQLTESIYQVW